MARKRKSPTWLDLQVQRAAAAELLRRIDVELKRRFGRLFA